MSEHLYSIALSNIAGIGSVNAKVLYNAFGSATALFENRKDILSYIPDATPRLVSALQSVDKALERAEKELAFIQNKKVSVLPMNDSQYPQRLKDCVDAPVVLYYCGNADLNRTRVVSMVGTRKCTEYGKDLCRHFVSELKQYYPDTLIVSGLAYGIDIHSHRAALENGMDTVCVFAHGLDRVYPQTHRNTAVEMVSHGGLLTEFMSGTTPERGNFLSRNRIVAGISDATIVVESAIKGGSLVTANLAIAYNRELMTFPGRVFDEQSTGCHKLVTQQKASLITGVEDFLKIMNWPNPDNNKRNKPLQQELFIDLTKDETSVIDVLRGVENMSIGDISGKTGLPFTQVTNILFELEMKNVVTVLGGAMYRLLR